jgi:hypothetical protein
LALRSGRDRGLRASRLARLLGGRTRLGGGELLRFSREVVVVVGGRGLGRRGLGRVLVLLRLALLRGLMGLVLGRCLFLEGGFVSGFLVVFSGGGSLGV